MSLYSQNQENLSGFKDIFCRATVDHQKFASELRAGLLMQSNPAALPLPVAESPKEGASDPPIVYST